MLLFASFDPLTIIGGVFIALAVQIFLPLPHSGFFRRLRVLPFLFLMLMFLRDVVLATWLVTKAVLATLLARLRGLPAPVGEGAVVVVPLKCAQDIVLAMTAGLINLVPGTIVLEVDAQAAELTLHVFDLEASGFEAGVVAATQAQEARIMRCSTGLNVRSQETSEGK